ncbi:endoplasmic reticulum protein [Kwoniella mangroviensis CBS 8886]|nr:endoplasmic reticulum protein [Kwoniella mangroviensis CBS 8886]
MTSSPPSPSAINKPNFGPTAPEDQPLRNVNGPILNKASNGKEYEKTSNLSNSPTRTFSSRKLSTSSQRDKDGFTPLRVYESRDAQNRKMPEAQVANNVGPAKAIAAGMIKPEDGEKKLEKFKYSFFSPEIAMFRKLAFKMIIGTVVITVLVMWMTLPFYWGSLWKSNRYTDKLTVRIIDRDGGEIGQTVTQGLLAQTNLRYFITSPSEFPDIPSIEDDIVNQGAWASIVINTGATTNLNQARSNGNASYNGSSAIDVFYAQARMETAVNSYLLPYMQQALGGLLGQYNARSVAQYLQANANNATAINALAAAPTTVSNPVWYTLFNLRPYNQPVAQAITLVGLIYMLIFSFIITMSNNAVREIIAPFLTTRAYLIYRIVAPLCLYFVISFFFAMINLPFKIHFGAHFTYAGGFFLWWFTLFLGMGAVGLSTEFMITILGPRFIAFFLLPLIIANVSVVSLPHELQPWIYRYGVAMPFYNASRVVRTIIFDTKNDIAENLGILLAWIAVNIITITLTTWLFRRKSVNQHNKEVGENELDSLERIDEA